MARKSKSASEEKPSSTSPSLSDRRRAEADMNAAATELLGAAAAYRRAWHQQREALDHVGEAFDSIERAFGQDLPDAVADALESYNAAASGATLFLIELDDEALRGLEQGARAVEDVAGAARRVADALAREGGDA